MKKYLTLFLIISLTQIGNTQIDTILSNQLQNILNSSVFNSGNNGVSAFVIMPDGQTWNNYSSLDVEFDTLITVHQLLNHTSGIADYLEIVTSGNIITSNFNYFFTPEYIDFILVTMANTQTSWFGIFNPMYNLLSDFIKSTDIIEFENKSGLCIFPNPTKSRFNIFCKQIISEIEITDTSGRIIYHDNPYNNHISLNIQEDGLYFVNIISEEQIIARKLIIKKNTPPPIDFLFLKLN